MPTTERTARGTSEIPDSVPRLLGATFLIVIATSLAGGLLLGSAVGTGSAADILSGATGRVDLLRVAVLVDLVTSLGIVALASLLYVILRTQDPVLARIALGWWLLEAAFMTISRVGVLVLIPIGQGFAGAGAGESSAYQTLVDAVYQGVVRNAYTIHMFFYCAGGILWYSLFYRSGYIPRALSLFGITAVILGMAGIVLQLLGWTVPLIVFLPILPFEVMIGAWLLLRGIETGSRVVAERGSGAVAAKPV